jgi:type I restriction enzyme S subunit
MSQLPQGWINTSLGDIAVISSGVGFPKNEQGKPNGQYPFAKVRDISEAVLKEDGLLNSAANYIDHSDLNRLRARPVPSGSTVFAKIGEALRLNRRAITQREVILDNNCMAVSPERKTVHPHYLFRFLTTVDISPLAVATSVPSVRKGDVEAINILPLRLKQGRLLGS